MVFLSDDAYSFIKRKYMKSCIVMFLGFACMYTISKKVHEQTLRIDNLTKEMKALKKKGD